MTTIERERQNAINSSGTISRILTIAVTTQYTDG